MSVKLYVCYYIIGQLNQRKKISECFRERERERERESRDSLKIRNVKDVNRALCLIIPKSAFRKLLDTLL